MPDARLERTREAYREKPVFPPNREIREGGPTPNLDALIAFCARFWSWLRSEWR